MNNDKSGLFTKDRTLVTVVSEVARLCSPELIYLYNQRVDSKNAVSSFKLCVIADVQNKYEIERDIYINIDSDIPFDVLIYTPDEWEKLTARPETFACKIGETGTVVYYG